MQEIISAFTAKYSLSRAEVITEIESFFSAMLSHWYHLPVLVFFRKDLRLEVVAYNDAGGVITQKSLDFLELKGRKFILRLVEERLTRVSVLKETRQYKQFEKQMRWGEIIGRDQEGNILVETEVMLGDPVIAVCPLNRIGVHERNTTGFRKNHRRAFHLCRVEPVAIYGTSRLKVVLDRVSRNLVETLLKNQLDSYPGKIQLRCLKRYVGHKSIVLSDKPLPKAAIINVDRELQERVRVFLVRSILSR